MICERCNKEVNGTPFDDDICEPCVNEMIGGGLVCSCGESLRDSMKEEFDFDKGEYKK